MECSEQGDSHVVNSWTEQVTWGHELYVTVRATEAMHVYEVKNVNSINPLSYLNNFDNNVFQFHDIDESIVEKIIDNFPSKNSCGYDGISLRLLTFCKLTIIKPLM